MLESLEIFLKDIILNKQEGKEAPEYSLETHL